MKDLEEINVGEMQKRQVIMADGKRYLIYYTFEESEPRAVANGLVETEETENV